MKLTHLTNLFILFFAFSQTANCQDRLTTIGTEQIDSRDSSAYTIGQITYRDKTSEGASAIKDIQYTYKIYNLNLNENRNNFYAQLFADPTSSYLILQLANYKNDNLSYQLIDMHGEIVKESKIDEAKIANNKTQIDVILLPISSYILNVFEKNEKKESFKIIKINNKDNGLISLQIENRNNVKYYPFGLDYGLDQ